jgi:hypothetical protein
VQDSIGLRGCISGFTALESVEVIFSELVKRLEYSGGLVIILWIRP